MEDNSSVEWRENGLGMTPEHYIYCAFSFESLVAQRLKCLPAVRETWVRFLGREDPLEKAMAPHSSILAWRTPWTEEPGGLRSTGSQSRTRLSDFTFTVTFLSNIMMSAPPQIIRY